MSSDGKKTVNPSPGAERTNLFHKTIEDLEGIELTNDPEQSLKTARMVRNALPESMRRCTPLDTIVVSAWEPPRTLAMELRHGLRTAWRSLVMIGADARAFFIEQTKTSSLAERILKQRPQQLDGSQRSTFHKILTFGLANLLSPEDLVEIAARIRPEGNGNEFLWRLFAGVSLAVAQKLVDAHSPKVKLFEGFDRFTETIGAAIADGRIGIRTKTAGELLKDPFTWAFYNTISNTIAFPPLDGDVAIESLFDSMIHELVHAYQDEQGLPISKLKEEEPAYTWEYALDLLLSERTPYTFASFHEDLPEEPTPEMIEEKQPELRNACPEYGEEYGALLYKKILRLQYDVQARKAEWKNEVAEVLVGRGTKDLHHLFHRFYSRSIYLDTRAWFSVRTEFEVSGKCSRGELKDPRDKIGKAIAQLWVQLPLFAEWRPWDPSQSGLRASFFLDFYAQAISLAHCIDAETWRGLLVSSYGYADVVGKALLYLPSRNNGIPPR